MHLYNEKIDTPNDITHISNVNAKYFSSVFENINSNNINHKLTIQLKVLSSLLHSYSIGLLFYLFLPISICELKKI